MTDVEVIIVGGGIAGASAAFHLAAHGRSVTLLERGEIASEASGVNAGGIGALGWGHLPDLESYLTMGSLQIFRSLQLDLGYDIEFRASGGLQAVQTEAQYVYARDRVLALKSRGYTLDLLTVNDARSIEPELSPELCGAIHFPLRGQADPKKATRAFADCSGGAGSEHPDRAGSDRDQQDDRGNLPSRLPGGNARSETLGPCGGGLVRAAGRDAWASHTHSSRARTDVGDAAAAAAGVLLVVLGRILRALEPQPG